MIRRFILSDLDQIIQIELQSFPKSPYDRATFINLYHLYTETFLVYVDKPYQSKEEKVLGYIVFTKDGHIISIAVHPKYRRKGIGKKLIQEVMKTPHLKNIWVEVRRSNKVAQAFYFREGFQIIGSIPDYYGNEDALILMWSLQRLTRSNPFAMDK